MERKRARCGVRKIHMKTTFHMTRIRATEISQDSIDGESSIFKREKLNERKESHTPTHRFQRRQFSIHMMKMS